MSLVWTVRRTTGTAQQYISLSGNHALGSKVSVLTPGTSSEPKSPIGLDKVILQAATQSGSKALSPGCSPKELYKSLTSGREALWEILAPDGEIYINWAVYRKPQRRSVLAKPLAKAVDFGLDAVGEAASAASEAGAPDLSDAVTEGKMTAAKGVNMVGERAVSLFSGSRPMTFWLTAQPTPGTQRSYEATTASLQQIATFLFKDFHPTPNRVGRMVAGLKRAGARLKQKAAAAAATPSDADVFGG